MIHIRRTFYCLRLSRLKKYGRFPPLATFVTLTGVLFVLLLFMSYPPAPELIPVPPFQSFQAEAHTLRAVVKNPRTIMTTDSAVRRTVPINVSVWDTQAKHTDRILEQLRYLPANMNTSKNVSIFIINMVGSENILPGRDQFLRDQCLVSNCHLTIDNPFDPPPAYDRGHMDAVITSEDVSDIVWLKNQRKPDDIWIYYMLESPETFFTTPEIASVFNWTATYRHDSTIVTPYEKWVPDYNNNPLEWRLTDDTKPEVAGVHHNYARGKTRLVAAVISNCEPPLRMRYVEKLNQYIQVDLYGICGKKPCGDDSECFGMLRRDYKFYLAFENVNCHDYITEKFFRNALSYGVVPVVFGAPVEDYVRSAPPLSYIHVEDFPSLRHLAEYLKLLDANDDLYNSYFRWKGQGDFINTKFWCRLCSMLNDLDKPRLTINNLEDWWKRQANCKSSFSVFPSVP